jgi:hypothetical protein
MKIIGLKTLVIIIIPIALASCNNYNQERTRNASNNFFEIKDSELIDITGSNIENLDKKNGFKNLFLGSKFESYNFNPRTWLITKDYTGIFTMVNYVNVDDEFKINGVKIKNVQLIFFNGELILIDVVGEKQDIIDNKILTVLEGLYGKPSDNLKKLEVVDGYCELILKYEKTEPPPKEIKIFQNNSSYMPPIIRSFNIEAGQYYEILNHNESAFGWKGNSVSLKYYFDSKTKVFYGKKLRNDFKPEDEKYRKNECSERFMISDIEGCKLGDERLEKYHTDMRNGSINSSQERLKNEIKKL